MENLVEKYNIDKTFYKRYFFDGAGISFGVDFQKFLLFKKGKFLNPKQKDFYINKYIEQEIIDFYENQKFYLPKIDFDITTRCTLKCKCCSNCTPVFAKAAEAKKVQHLVMTDKEFQHSLDALLLAVDRINVLQLMGGEPLTNKYLSEIIEYCASKEQIDVIKIVTNGTVIPQGDLISIVQKYKDKIYFYISNYSSNEKLQTILKHEKIQEILKQNDIKYQMVRDFVWVEELPWHKELYTDEELKNLFENCAMASCISVLNNKLHICGKSSRGYELGLIDVDDYVDLDDADLKNKLIQFFHKPCFEACRYCVKTNIEVPPALQEE